MAVACGIDFGTTNSSIAVNVDGDVRVVPVDGGLPLLKSQLFLHRDGDRSCGSRSSRRYLNESQYRTRCVSCDRTPDRFIAPAGSALTWLPEGCRQYRPGGGCSDARLLRGLKAELPDLNFTRTTSWAIEYSVESLVAIVLRELKRQSEQLIGASIADVVLGRPVLLAESDEEDQLVEDRLLRAAQQAGFSELAVCPEPVAAALEPVFGPARGCILSLDFGAGTFDAAVLRVHDDEGGLTPELEGAGGANVGGDVIDGIIFDRYFANYLGLTAGEDELGFRLPNRVRWRMKTRAGLVRLATTEPALYELIDRGTRSRRAGQQMARLRDLLFGGYGFGFYEAIETAKCDLSEKDVSAVRFHGGTVDVDQPMRRSDLKVILAPILTAVSTAIDDALAQAERGPDEIDMVLLTGGSSQLSAFQDLIQERFQGASIVAGDTYTSVARGLATIAPQFFGGPA
jgi:hypothetical chaperone protein